MTDFRTVCLQCSMRAIVEGKDVPIFNEHPLVHMAQFHADPEQVRREREELSVKLEQMLKDGTLGDFQL